MQDFNFQLATGEGISPWLDDLAALRIAIFREYPYLYQGELEQERTYLAGYAASAAGFVILVRHQGRTVGAGTGMPLRDESPELLAPFLEVGSDVQDIFYLGELILLPPYRGQGLGRELLAACERQALACGDWRRLALATVIRPPDHPQSPSGYRPLDNFLHRCGYLPQPQFTAWFSWRDVGAADATRKPMRFWLKSI